jgi:hypothetical protein
LKGLNIGAEDMKHNDHTTGRDPVEAAKPGPEDLEDRDEAMEDEELIEDDGDAVIDDDDEDFEDDTGGSPTR